MQQQCVHCGEFTTQEMFCCNGCKMVYELLQENGLCTYYQLNDKPGVAQRMKVREDKFEFLDDTRIQQQLVHYRDKTQTHVRFHIPNIHCSSCLWLLENLHRLDSGIQQVNVNFAKKEATIVFFQHRQGFLFKPKWSKPRKKLHIDHSGPGKQLFTLLPFQIIKWVWKLYMKFNVYYLII